MYMRLGRGFIEDFNIFYLNSNIQLKENYKEDVINRIIFFCLQKCDENKNNIKELLNYMNNNFIFDQNLEIKEIKNVFLQQYKEEIKNSLNTIWIKEKKIPKANVKEKLSALKFIIDLNKFIANKNYSEMYVELSFKHHNIINYIITKFSLEKYFDESFNETKEVSKILFNFDLSFYLLENKISSFDNFIRNKELNSLILKSFKSRTNVEKGFNFKASEIIKYLESNKPKTILNHILLNELGEYFLCDLVELDLYSYNIDNYLTAIKKEYEENGEHLVRFSISTFKTNIYKSEINLMSSKDYLNYNYVSERICSILIKIKQI